ncbi:hypothetical protein ACJJTC_012558 [Scirpophaga incertulas]
MSPVINFAVLCSFFGLGYAIMCYECNSAKHAHCADNLQPAFLRNCSAHERGVTHTLCRKIVQHVEFYVNGQLPASRVIRACGWDDTKYKGSCYRRSGFGGGQEVCSCTEDLCNGSPETQTELATLIFTIVSFRYI